jgi:hypothetical protein
MDTIDLKKFGTGISASAPIASATPENGGNDTADRDVQQRQLPAEEHTKRFHGAHLPKMR